MNRSASNTPSVRDWIRTAPLLDVFLMGIVKGLEGYSDDDTERPIYVLRTLAEVFKDAGWVNTNSVETWDGVTTGDLRFWAQKLLIETGAVMRGVR